MKADNFIKILRKIIREELRSVVREELGLMLETSATNKPVVESKQPVIKNSLIESIKPVKKTPPPSPSMFSKNSVLNSILNETAQSGEWRSVLNGNSSMAPNFGPSMGEYGGGASVSVVESVDQMLATARPAGDVSHVQIDAVPDFTALMGKLKEKGSI